MPDATILHGAACLLQGSIWSTASDLIGHHVADGGLGRSTALSDDTLKNVSFAEHAYDVLAVEDEKSTDFVFCHEAGGVQHRRLTVDGPDLRAFLRQNVTDRRHVVAPYRIVVSW